MSNNERICIQSDAIPAPRFRYSPCVQIGPVVQVSGMVALDPDSGQLVSGGPGAETACILANLQRALPDYDVTLDDLLIARIFTTRFDAFADINAAWDQGKTWWPVHLARRQNECSVPAQKQSWLRADAAPVLASPASPE